MARKTEANSLASTADRGQADKVGKDNKPAGPSNVKELRSFLRTDALTTPLDGILNPANATYGGIEQQVPLLNNPSRSQYGDFTVPQPLQSQSNAWLESRASEMFLRPAQLQKGEKALRIVDYIDNIVPKDEERTLADGGNTKLVVSYGPTKPRLEKVSIPLWVVSKTRIFYNLLTSKKLATQPDVQNYLAYTIKIMEL